MVRFRQAFELLLSVALLAMANLPRHGAARAGMAGKEWPEGKSYSLKELEVSLSAPVLVGRSKGYFWQPTFVRLSSGDLLAAIWNLPDTIHRENTSLFSWSSDRGLTRSEPIQGEVYDIALRLPSGDELLLPFNLYPHAHGEVGGHYQICPKGRREIRLVKEGLTITGWPRPLGYSASGSEQEQKQLGLASFVFEGQSVRLKSGEYLATLYGTFRGDKVSSVVAAESLDGIHWKVRSVIADPENCAPILKGSAQPSEPSLCRLADGRLMCVFRLLGNSQEAPYPCGQSWSSDKGKTWSKPIAMVNVFPVQPSLAVMKDGTVVLSGGRPGIYAWFNSDRTGKAWEGVDMAAHHNAFVPNEPLKETFDKEHPIASFRTSAYTEVITLDDTHALYIYDRIPNGWYPIPQSSPETNSVWVVRMTVRRK